MIIIKGNLIIKDEGNKFRTESILKQVQNRVYSETSSEQINQEIVALADLTLYDIANATIIEGDSILDYLDLDEITLVTGEVVEGGYDAS